MTTVVYILCLLAVVFDRVSTIILDSIKRAVITLTPIIDTVYTTGVYMVYPNDAFTGITTIEPMLSYRQRLTRVYTKQAAMIGQYQDTLHPRATVMYSEHNPWHTPAAMCISASTRHVITNVCPYEVECLPCEEEVLSESMLMPPKQDTEDTGYDQDEPVSRRGWNGWFSSHYTKGHVGYRACGYKRVKSLEYMTPRVTTSWADEIIKSEQEEEMWAGRCDALDADDLLHRGQHPFEFLCDMCGSNACSCEEDRAINEQAEYDEANGLCLNCHQSPCCFDCCYDETEEDRLQWEEYDLQEFNEVRAELYGEDFRDNCPMCAEYICRCGSDEDNDEYEEDLNGFPSWWVIKAYGTDCARCDQHVGYCDCESGPYPPSCGPSSFED